MKLEVILSKRLAKYRIFSKEEVVISVMFLPSKLFERIPSYKYLFYIKK